MVFLTFCLAALLALVHLFAGGLRFLHVVPRSRWLSAASGVAVAYVFLHVLPELAAHRETFATALGTGGKRGETWVYSIALVGLAVFYGLERIAKLSRARSRGARGDDRTEAHVFWLHATSFAVYNMLIGYLLLHREEEGLWSLAVFFVAMALHFVTNDFGMREDHKERYDATGRWVLAASVMLGWAIGVWVELPRVVIGLVFAFLAGGVVLNVLKEELPEERQSRFLPFLLGAAGYGTLLVIG